MIRFENYIFFLIIKNLQFNKQKTFDKILVLNICYNFHVNFTSLFQRLRHPLVGAPKQYQ